MGNPQDVTFTNLEDFMKFLPEVELQIVLCLQNIIFECMPDCKEKLAYNVPFYYRHSRICFIWPASIAGGNVEHGVAIGFCKGESFLDETFESSKFNSKKIYTSLTAIDVAVLKQQIYDAVSVDNQIVKAKRRRIQ